MKSYIITVIFTDGTMLKVRQEADSQMEAGAFFFNLAPDFVDKTVCGIKIEEE